MSLSTTSGDTGPPVPNYNLTAVLIYGQLKKLSSRRLAEVLARRNSRLTKSRRKATATVVAHSSAASLLSDSGEVALPGDPAHDTVLSEQGFLQAIGMRSRAAPVAGPYRLPDVAKAAGLPVAVCQSLTLFDLIHPVGDRFGYQDLATARQVAGLMRSKVRLAAIVDAGTALADRGLRLSQVRLVDAPWGIAQQIGDRLARLDGQLTFVLEDEAVDAAECFAKAEACEQNGEFAEAERWYARAERVERNDPVLPFNRGNVLAAAGRPRDAQLAFKQALARDPSFAEAAFNLGKLYEAGREIEPALLYYAQALEAHAGYPEALFNLARLLTEVERYSEALPLWRSFVEAWPDDPDIGHARRLGLLCRLQTR